MGAVEANAAAWHHGRRLLERAIAERLTFAFETTLGGRTITTLLDAGPDCGARGPHLVRGPRQRGAAHRARPAAASAAAATTFPRQKIRERYDQAG